jgi:hypothetical protein
LLPALDVAAERREADRDPNLPLVPSAVRGEPEIPQAGLLRPGVQRARQYRLHSAKGLLMSVARVDGWRLPSCGPNCCAHGDAWRALGPVVTGPLVVDFDECRARLAGRPVALTATETRIMVVLARRLGRLCSHRLLLERVWGPEYADAPHLLRVNISRIRVKLGPSHHLIESRPGLGFALRALPPCGPDEVPPVPKPQVLERGEPGQAAARFGPRMIAAVRALSEASPEWIEARRLGPIIFAGTYLPRSGMYAHRVVKRLVARGVPIEVREGWCHADSSYRLAAPYLAASDA